MFVFFTGAGHWVPIQQLPHVRGSSNLVSSVLHGSPLQRCKILLALTRARVHEYTFCSFLQTSTLVLFQGTVGRVGVSGSENITAGVMKNISDSSDLGFVANLHLLFRGTFAVYTYVRCLSENLTPTGRKVVSHISQKRWLPGASKHAFCTVQTKFRTYRCLF